MTQSDGVEFYEGQQEDVTFSYLEHEKLGKGIRVSEEIWDNHTVRGDQDLFSELVSEPVSEVKLRDDGQVVFVERRNNTNKCAYRITEKDTHYYKRIVLQPCVKNGKEITLTWNTQYVYSPVVNWTGQGTLKSNDLRIFYAPDMLVLMEINEHTLATTINL